jgi:hypothetical protein
LKGPIVRNLLSSCSHDHTVGINAEDNEENEVDWKQALGKYLRSRLFGMLLIFNRLNAKDAKEFDIAEVISSLFCFSQFSHRI